MSKRNMETNFEFTIAKAFGLAIGFEKTEGEMHDYWDLNILILFFHFHWNFCRVNFE